jgi:hypothetical protein
VLKKKKGRKKEMITINHSFKRIGRKTASVVNRNGKKINAGK